MLLPLPLIAALAVAPPLLTVAEQSGFVRTGRYDEVPRLCAEFPSAYPGRARCLSFGVTPEGREMKALVLSDDGVLEPAQARERQRPVILVQGGIHAGEIDGKDAGFLLARELLEGKLEQDALSAVTLVFVPVFNVDGHERWGKHHRPNQRGPVEGGWRTTAQNLNLNRDYLKADAPEMRAMIGLLLEWDPVLYVDLHVTDGAKFQHDVAVLIDPALAGPPPLQGHAKALQRALLERLRAAGHKPLDFYPSFEVDDDPSSGFAVGVAPPRFSQPFWALHNRMGMLVETHSWKDYRTRVRATHDVLVGILAEARTQGIAWRKAGLALDAEVAKGPGEVVLAWDNSDEKRTIDFLGYHYTRLPSAVSGTLRTVYDESKPEVWKVPLLPSVKPALTVTAPKAGYVVPAAFAPPVRALLRAHGISFGTVAHDDTRELEVFRATAVSFGPKPYEGRMTAKVQGAWTKERRTLERGALFVPVTQRFGRLVVHLFEPQAPDSLVAWGSFNVAFEQKEYMEGYVAEEVAERALRDPKVAAEFAAALADPELQKDPARRLDFFYRRHPSWDERKDLVPIVRVDAAPELQ
ncbi:MAG: M14 family metallopeptidase [Deltaproteobacteria bacterium]|nr:M14 family metallopeptidase [Deltaproteobacteria bacterium]